MELCKSYGCLLGEDVPWFQKGSTLSKIVASGRDTWWIFDMSAEAQWTFFWVFEKHWVLHLPYFLFIYSYFKKCIFEAIGFKSCLWQRCLVNSRCSKLTQKCLVWSPIIWCFKLEICISFIWCMVLLTHPRQNFLVDVNYARCVKQCWLNHPLRGEHSKQYFYLCWLHAAFGSGV